MKPSATPRAPLQSQCRWIYHDGAAIVPLDPSDGMQNAHIIYQVIQSLPATQQISGDFDRKGRPFVYFPDRVSKIRSHPLALKNRMNGRVELAGFIESIRDAAFSAKFDQAAHSAAMRLGLTSKSVMVAEREFTVEDLRETLETLSNQYLRDHPVRKEVLPEIPASRPRVNASANAVPAHRGRVRSPGSKISGRGIGAVTSPRSGASHKALMRKRLGEFVRRDESMTTYLHQALKEGAAALKTPTNITPEQMGVRLHKLMDTYVSLMDLANKPIPLRSFIRTAGKGPVLQAAADCWLKVSQQPYRGARLMLSTQSWPLAIDEVCRMIVAMSASPDSERPQPQETSDAGQRQQLLRDLSGRARVEYSSIGGRSDQESSLVMSSPVRSGAPSDQRDRRGSDQPALSPSRLPPGTPEDERALKRVLSSSGFPGIPYSGLNPAALRTEPSRSALQARQAIPGHLIEASAHLLPEAGGEAETPASKKKLVARLALNPAITLQAFPAGFQMSSLDRLGSDAGYFAEPDNSATPMPVTMGEITRKLSTHTGIVYSSVAIEVPPDESTEHERTAKVPVRYPKQGFDPNAPSSTDEDY